MAGNPTDNLYVFPHFTVCWLAYDTISWLGKLRDCVERVPLAFEYLKDPHHRGLHNSLRTQRNDTQESIDLYNGTGRYHPKGFWHSSHARQTVGLWIGRSGRRPPYSHRCPKGHLDRCPIFWKAPELSHQRSIDPQDESFQILLSVSLARPDLHNFLEPADQVIFIDLQSQQCAIR